ncbi:MAG: YggT family protein [Alphaproteobacteria bacterium]|nr:YggT family protein [Alphaproteobacteria bacterium]
MVLIVAYILRGLALICIIDALLSWVMPDPHRYPRKLTHALTEPMYAPIHALINPQMTGGLDFSPIVMIMLFSWLANILEGAAL